MRLRIAHTTTYRYDEPIGYALQRVRLTPATSGVQEVIEWDMTITGGTRECSYFDHYGNAVDLLMATPGVQEMQIAVAGVVETTDTAGVLGQIYGRAPLWHFQQATPLTTAGPGVQAITAPLGSGTADVAQMHALSAAILEAVPYTLYSTEAATTAEDAIAQAQGVCQDHANIFIAAARHMGLPARYVSGYLDMDDRIDQEASHAWAEVHLEGLGWTGFDVSNGQSPDARYVRLAIGRDAADAAPISGLRQGPGDESLIVTLQVQQ